MQSIILERGVFPYGSEWNMGEKALLSDDEWPESLQEKLKNFVVK